MNKDVELILSSGFLAFAHHSAFLASVEQLNLNVKGIMGTSSGALAGAMFAAGYKADEISKELTRLPYKTHEIQASSNKRHYETKSSG